MSLENNIEKTLSRAEREANKIFLMFSEDQVNTLRQRLISHPDNLQTTVVHSFLNANFPDVCQSILDSDPDYHTKVFYHLAQLIAKNQFSAEDVNLDVLEKHYVNLISQKWKDLEWRNKILKVWEEIGNDKFFDYFFTNLEDKNKHTSSELQKELVFQHFLNLYSLEVLKNRKNSK